MELVPPNVSVTLTDDFLDVPPSIRAWLRYTRDVAQLAHTNANTSVPPIIDIRLQKVSYALPPTMEGEEEKPVSASLDHIPTISSACVEGVRQGLRTATGLVNAVRKVCGKAPQLQPIEEANGNTPNGEDPPSTTSNETLVLSPISGLIEAGSTLLVGGPAGCGASTLLQLLANRLEPTSGTILYGGETAVALREKAGIEARRMTAYSHPIDVHQPLLSVRETFLFAYDSHHASDEKVPQIGTKSAVWDRDTVVDALIEFLGLISCQNTIVGDEKVRGISGGQRRRVTVGEMLLSHARILCMDEPSTGLDALTTYQLVLGLRAWSRVSGGIVAMTLLQPPVNVFELFDSLCMLREGQVVFHGPRAMLIPYFATRGLRVPSTMDVADWLLAFLQNPSAILCSDLAQEANALRIARIMKRFRKAVLVNRAFKITPSSSSPAAAAAAAASRPAVVPATMSQDAVEVTVAPIPSVTQEEATDAEGTSVFAVRIHLDEDQKDPIPVDVNGKDQPTNGHHKVDKVVENESIENTVKPVFVRNGSAFDSLDSSRVPLSVSQSVPLSDIPLSTMAMAKSFQASPLSQLHEKLSHQRNEATSFPSDAMKLQKLEFPQQFYRGPSAHNLMTHAYLCLRRQWLVSQSSLYLYLHKILQTVVMALALGSVFWDLSPNAYADRLGILLFTLVCQTFSNLGDVPAICESKILMYKQTDAKFFPVLAEMLAAIVFYVPWALVDTILFGTLIYWMASFSPVASCFVLYLVLLLMMHVVMSFVFRFLAYYYPNADMAMSMAVLTVPLFFLFAGFLIPHANVPDFLIWMYWISPYQWILHAQAVVEFGSSRYDEILSSVRLGDTYLAQYGMDPGTEYIWAAIIYIAGLSCITLYLAYVTASRPHGPLVIGTKRSDPVVEELSGSGAQQVWLQDAFSGPNGTLNREHLKKICRGHSATTNNGANTQLASPSSNAPAGIVSLTWQNLCYSVPDVTPGSQKQLLTNVDGYIMAGSITALMGSSGAGKTTLLDCLAGRKTTGTLTGDIQLNGKTMAAGGVGSSIGYCEQMDIHNPFQTLGESLFFAARLRLPSTSTDAECTTVVNETMELLQITHLQHRLVASPATGGLSPCERKLLTIATELVTKPAVLFLDEPTSGLDASAAWIVARALKQVARSGKACICTIHQPSSNVLSMFDRLVLLTGKGELAYCGALGQECDALIQYFESKPSPSIVSNDPELAGIPSRPPVCPPNVNPSEWVLDLLGQDQSNRKINGELQYPQFFMKSDLSTSNKHTIGMLQASAPVESGVVAHVSFSFQLYLVTRRAFRSYWRNLEFNMTRLLMFVLLGFVFGFSYLNLDDTDQTGVDSKISAIFLSTFNCAIQHSVMAVPLLFEERNVLYRELGVGTYSPLAYALSLGLIEIPYVATCCILFILPFYFMVGLVWSGALFFQYLLILFLLSLAFSYYGQLCVASFPSIGGVFILQSFLENMLVLFGGVFVHCANIPKAWMWFYYLDPLPKAVNALVTSQLECTGSGCHKIEVLDVHSGATFLQSRSDYAAHFLNTGVDFFWQNAGWLLFYCAIFRILIALLIQFVSFKRR